MVRSVPFWVLGAVVALGVPCAAAGDPSDRAEDVPLYTNADLLQFGNPEPVPAEATDDDDGIDRERQFVEDFLDREYSRVEADQRLALARSSQAAANEPQETYDEYGPYFIGGYGGYYGGYYGGCGRGCDDRRGGYDRLLAYDIRTARHGYYVPARRFDSGRPHSLAIGQGGGRMTRHAVGHGSGSRGRGRH